MRLNPEQIKAIKDTVSKNDAKARVFLFGSRVDDAKRGGDIDLLIISESLTNEDKDRILNDLYNRLGEQRIDIVLASDYSRPFVRIAAKQAVSL